MIQIVKDIDLINEINKYDYTIVPTNCYCCFGNGFSFKLRKKYPYVFEIDKKTMYGDKNKLGTILEASYKKEPKFIISYITFGFNFRPDLIKDYLDYEALSKCLLKINSEYKEKSIASPLIGCNKFDGNGDKDKVIGIIKEICTNINLTIYDYIQRDKYDENLDEYKKMMAIRENNYDLYHSMVKKQKEDEKKLKQYIKQIKEDIKNENYINR